MRIAVVGLGKLGAPLAAVLADAGSDVIGVDTRPDAVALLNEGRAPVDEPHLQDLIARNRPRLRATTDMAAAVAGADLTFIIVPTPSLPTGSFSLQFVLDAIDRVGRALAHASSYHVVTVTSTVAPLSMDQEIRPALERASGRRVGESLGLCYNPEFIALGSVIHDMCHPDLVLIGESDARAGDTLEAVHRSVVGDAVPVRRMNLVNAEVAKIAVNAFVTTKISYANMLAELCERLPGGDAGVVTGAIGHDGRIGHRFFKGALGYGGPCFPRDNAAFAAVAAQHGAHADLAVATEAVNRRQVDRLAALVRAQLGARRRVGVLGLSYKSGTHVVEESQALQLANALAGGGLRVTAYDPAAAAEATPHLAPTVVLARSVEACVEASDVVVVAVPWPEFSELPAVVSRLPHRPLTLVDCWRFIDAGRLPDHVKVVYIGRHAAASVVGADRIEAVGHER
jgi:UDPglucose 6-dehydrogenase